MWYLVEKFYAGKQVNKQQTKKAGFQDKWKIQFIGPIEPYRTSIFEIAGSTCTRVTLIYTLETAKT
jgi:hypothetical protein